MPQRKHPHLPQFQSLLLVTAASGMALAGALALTGCKSGHAASPGPGGPMPVTVVRVQPSEIALKREWVGTLDGYVNAQIQPQVTGYLVRQNYTEGSAVRKGDALFEIDQRPFQAALDQAQGQLGQAEAQLAQAHAQLTLADINVKRDTPMVAQRAIAESQLDNELQQQAQAQAAVKQAEAAIATAKANVSTARINLGFTEVRSLISGVAGLASTQVGNLVSPQSVLTAVSQLDPIKVYFSISDSEYLDLTRRAGHGGDLLKASGNLPLTLTLADGTVYPHQGRIVFIDRQMNQQTGAIRIAAAFPNPGNLLRPGQFGRVSAATDVTQNALLVPQVAVQELQGIQQVATVDASGKAHIVNVMLGAQYGTNWVVTGGIEPGTRVITDNLQKLREGVPVAPTEVSLASAAAATSTPNGSTQAGR
ncbi:MAG TPA: efflux RND transporter periplasmic adaptor subunit [Terracidiphilus sp.]|nr:efflux RND transporter periplasmic adaptor subunit [Terracidiphilus sp.]